MRATTKLLLCLLMIGCALGTPQRTVKVTVLDDGGTPIEGASATVVALGTSEPTRRITGPTDASGVFQAIDRPQLRMSAWAEKEGYYRTDAGRLSRKKNHAITLVLKKKINPVPLYAKDTHLVPPVLGENLGYDFKIRDWIAPHGKGKRADVFFKVLYEQRSLDDFDYHLEVSFPHELDGIQSFYDHSESELKSPHEAPLDGYLSRWVQDSRRRPGMARTGNRDSRRNYWIRIRSETGGKGEMISAHYIKMYGDFPTLKCYFNPSPNDRNLEFDPQRNLFTNLDSTERVNDP